MRFRARVCVGGNGRTTHGRRGDTKTTSARSPHPRCEIDAVEMRAADAGAVESGRRTTAASAATSVLRIDTVPPLASWIGRELAAECDGDPQTASGRTERSAGRTLDAVTSRSRCRPCCRRTREGRNPETSSRQPTGEMSPQSRARLCRAQSAANRSCETLIDVSSGGWNRREGSRRRRKPTGTVAPLV